MRYRSAVALGSNLGDRRRTLVEAVRGLRTLGGVAAVSPLFETAPVGGPDQGQFLNAVALLDTSIPPHEIMVGLLELEDAAGRERSERWGPRTLDLDLLTVVDDTGAMQVSGSEALTLPHPRAAQRRFVLEPLVAVWPNAPLGGEATAADLLTVAPPGDIELFASRWVGGVGRRQLMLLAAQMALLALFAATLVASGSMPASFGWREGLGLMFATIGVALGAWAVAALGPSVTPLPEPLPGAGLVTSGPYRWLRHPIYSGLLLLLLGVSTVFGSLAAAAVTAGMTLFLSAKARFEERRLMFARVGYGAYAKQVRGRLVPRA